jgi:hypothetical protein
LTMGARCPQVKNRHRKHKVPGNAVVNGYFPRAVPNRRI